MNDIKKIPEQLADFVPRLKRYAPLLFCLLLVILYGLLVYRVQVLNSSEPSSADLASQRKTAVVPHIDDATLNQLKNLQDNSVSVQALFVQARSNPFQE